jgi:hypothetical protein
VDTLAADEVAEVRMVRKYGLQGRLLRTPPPSWGSNCHGWVFTGGRFGLEGGDVERILQDNGYQAVTTPQAGDLAIYRDRYGHIGHSAVVRAAEEGRVLLESKWGHLGRYLHRPEDYRPVLAWTYYRSPRHGHLLQGLNAPSPSADDLESGRPSLANLTP